MPEQQRRTTLPPIQQFVTDSVPQKDEQKQIVEELKQSNDLTKKMFGSLSGMFNPAKQEAMLSRLMTNTTDAIKSALNDVGSVISGQIAQSPLLASAFSVMKNLGQDVVGMFSKSDEMTDDEKEKLADERNEQQIEAIDKVGQNVEMLANVIPPSEEEKRESKVQQKKMLDTLQSISDKLGGKTAGKKVGEEGDETVLDSMGFQVFAGNLALGIVKRFGTGLLTIAKIIPSLMLKFAAKAVPIAAIVLSLFSGISNLIESVMEGDDMTTAFIKFGEGIVEAMTFGLLKGETLDKVRDFVSMKMIEPVMNFLDNISFILAAGWGNMINKFKEVFPQITNWINETFGDFFQWINEKMEPFRKVREMAIEGTTDAIENFMNWLGELRDKFNSLASMGLDFISDIMKKISNFYANLFDNVVLGALSLVPDFIKNNVDSLKQFEEDTMKRMEERNRLRIESNENRSANLEQQTKETEQAIEQRKTEQQAQIVSSAIVVNNNKKQSVNVFGGLDSGAQIVPAALVP